MTWVKRGEGSVLQLMVQIRDDAADVQDFCKRSWWGEKVQSAQKEMAFLWYAPHLEYNGRSKRIVDSVTMIRQSLADGSEATGVGG